MTSPAPSGPATVPRIQGIRILIVEDEPFIALDLMMAIEDAGGVAIGPAASVAEAIDFWHTEKPDAAIVDVHLPDGTIGGFLDAVSPGLPIVVHTGVGLPADVRARHPDIPEYSKPTAPALLISSIAERLFGG